MATTSRRLVRAPHAGPAAGLVAQLALLAVLAGTVGLGAAGWVVGCLCAAAVTAGLTAALARSPENRLGRASQVTLARVTLAVGVAALVAHGVAAEEAPAALIVTLAAVALALDAVDGRLARRTGTTTALGARFDGEADAFLILVLSVHVAGAVGAWVLAVGAARYVFLAGGWPAPWLRAPLPPRRWRKVVAAIQGIALTVAAADVVPVPLMKAVLAVALALLVASVGECVWWLWRRRPAARDRPPAAAPTVLAVLIVWAVLVVPDHPGRLEAGALARLPLELPALVAAAVALPARTRRALAAAAGAALGALVLLKALNLGFYTAFDRPFNPVHDLGYAAAGVETLRDAAGASRAYLAVALVLIGAVALAVLPVAALLRVTRVAGLHRRRALQAAAALGVLWVALRALGAPVASTDATALAVREARAAHSALQDGEALAREISGDPFHATPGDRLLTALRGKDVLVIFAESYGRVAVEGSSFAPRIRGMLGRETARLRAAGFASRSAFLTSPTFGGLSWLAHATLQSGVWIDHQRRHDRLLASGRLTLSRAFSRAGWRAVAAMPQNKRPWPAGSAFYGFDTVHDRRTLGYRGPSYGLPPMPDQYALSALWRLELAGRSRPPLFAEVNLVSSHAPWARIPRLAPWEDIGDGSIFHRLREREATRARLGARAAYAASIEYTLSAIFSFVRRYGDDRLVVVVAGDHQPATTITGHGAGRDVPVSIVAGDPAVLDRIAGWGWQDGLRPSPGAPVWPMSAFRDRFLTAFGSSPAAG